MALRDNSAADILAECGVHRRPGAPVAEAWPSFHTLDSDTVARLIGAADRVAYRSPKNANGSRGRYFYAALVHLWRRQRL